jgi:hypothetical protein
MADITIDSETIEKAKEILDEAAKLLIRNFPAIRELASQIVEVVFVPRAIGRQLVLAVALETGMVSLD